MKEEGNYIYAKFTNDYIPSWLWCLHDLVLSRLLFEPASDCRKTNKGWGCVEKVVETKLIAVFIIYIIVVPANCDN